ncbi:hypothetical protein B0H13DRAFT_2404488 [Mycena leptocephala]|nr:hypothetical protein B0H13DRAFT_2404488 [Mycena leptocephala]
MSESNVEKPRGGPLPKPVPAYLPTTGSPLTVDKELYTKIRSAPCVLVEEFRLEIRSGRAWTAPAGSIVQISTPEGPQVERLANKRRRCAARRARLQCQQRRETMGKELWKPFVMRTEKHGVLERWRARRGAGREWQRAWRRACSSKEERQVRCAASTAGGRREATRGGGTTACQEQRGAVQHQEGREAMGNGSLRSNAPLVTLGAVLEGSGKRRERGSGESDVCDAPPVALGAGGRQEVAGAMAAGGREPTDIRRRKWQMFAEMRRARNLSPVLQDVTLEFSKKGVPTICKVLPLYKLMETKLSELADEYEFEEPEISRALRAGSDKAGLYVGKALISDYALLGTGSYPVVAWQTTLLTRC